MSAWLIFVGGGWFMLALQMSVRADKAEERLFAVVLSGVATLMLAHSFRKLWP